MFNLNPHGRFAVLRLPAADFSKVGKISLGEMNFGGAVRGEQKNSFCAGQNGGAEEALLNQQTNKLEGAI